jgi:hypothetical protein
MKKKQKSFIENGSIKPSSYRPNSSTKNTRFIKHTINNSLSDLYPPITYTMPTKKKQSRIGKQIAKEQLYEENIQLKERINKMRKEMDEIKNKLFKKDLELIKKDKIMRDLSRENLPEYTREINKEKAKESSLLSMCRQKYNEVKEQYKKKCEENDVLKMNIKLTKLKECQIQIETLSKEMEKLRNLYINSQTNYENCLKEIKEIQDIKKEFSQQHSIINSLNKKNKDLLLEMNFMRQENQFLKNELSKNQQIQKKLKKNNLKLKLSNEKYMTLKKRNENNIIINNDNIRQLKNLRKDLAEYKSLYLKQSEQYQNLLKKGSTTTAIKKPLSFKPFNYENVKNTEENQLSQNQSQLYRSLLEEAKIKNKIFENFLMEHDINPEQILKDRGYDGIMNFNKNTIKIKKTHTKSSPNNSVNTKDATSVATKENQDASKNLNNTQSNIDKDNICVNNNNLISNTKKSNENNNEISNGEKIEKTDDYIKQNENENEKENQEETKDFNIEENKENNPITNEHQDTMKMTQSQNSDFNTQELLMKENQLLALLHTFVKNLEANHVTKEQLISKIKQISLLFENKEEATKEEFIEPFTNLFIESMKVTQSSDIQLINEFFNNFIDDMEGDTNRFFLELMDIFENIVDYTLVENEEEVLNAIAMELQLYKDNLKLKLQNHENNLITFDYLRKIIEELNISLSDDYTEFLIYKMKEKVPENHSIFDLNYTIILDLLDKDINNNININNDKEEKKIDEENESKENFEEEEMNIQMSNKLSELKQALKENNTTFNDECKEKMKIFEDENKNKINGINKDDFFDLMKKYNIDIEDKVKDAIFDLFKLDTDVLLKSESEFFLLDYDKLCSIL